MKDNLLKNLAPSLIVPLKQAGKLADTLGIPAYVVGGFVRDILLKRENLDLDIVVVSNATDFARHLAKIIPGKLTTHKQFGTATLFARNFRIDLATARKDYYSQPAALPQVLPGTIRDDLFRRDFTINAMAVSLSNFSFGKLLDFFGGLNDLKEKQIRILHDLSFVDDPTRILRAIRFSERFGFKIEKKTSCLMREALKKKMLLQVKPPRIFDELVHILKEDNPTQQVAAVNRICAFDFIDKKVTVDSTVTKSLKKAEKEIYWFKIAFTKKRRLDSWLIYFMILLDKVNKLDTIYKLISRLNLKRGEGMRIVSYKKIGKVIEILKSEKLSLSKIFKILEPLSYEVILLIKIKSDSPLVQKRIIAFFKILNGMKLEARGDDLRKLGLKPGRNFGLLLERALHKKIDGNLLTKQEELDFIKREAQVK